MGVLSVVKMDKTVVNVMIHNNLYWTTRLISAYAKRVTSCNKTNARYVPRFILDVIIVLNHRTYVPHASIKKTSFSTLKLNFAHASNCTSYHLLYNANFAAIASHIAKLAKVLQGTSLPSARNVRMALR
jgi:hypothetical protein